MHARNYRHARIGKKKKKKNKRQRRELLAWRVKKISEELPQRQFVVQRFVFPPLALQKQSLSFCPEHSERLLLPLSCLSVSSCSSLSSVCLSSLSRSPGRRKRRQLGRQDAVADREKNFEKRRMRGGRLEWQRPNTR